MSNETDLNKKLAQWWRDLGFFYDLDEENKNWIISGSKNGILKFSKILRDYSKNPSNKAISEHDHFGPYGYLKITTSNTPEITDDGIFGQLSDIGNLSKIVEEKLQGLHSGESFEIKDEYNKEGSYKIKFFVKDDNYDPPQDDKSIQ